LTQEGLGALASALIEQARTISAKEAAVRDCVRRLQRARRKRREAELREQLRLAQAAGETDHVQRLLEEFQHVVKGGVE
jgi:hypothetical protein